MIFPGEQCREVMRKGSGREDGGGDLILERFFRKENRWRNTWQINENGGNKKIRVERH